MGVPSPSAPGIMDGRVAIVTGATSGIGREIALGLARLGATTVVVGRRDERAAAVAASLASETGNRRVDSIGVSDLALRAEMHRLADECLRRYPKIHVLVNNAGAYFARRETTSDGLERTFALNVLAPFVLTRRLSERLKESSPARVIHVSSAAHRGYEVDWDDLQQERRYSGFRTYGISKLELILLTRELARQLTGTGVTVNAVHPGFVRSGFGQNNGGGVAFGIRLSALLFAISPARGARTPLFLASDPSVSQVTGQYFVRQRPVSPSTQALDAESARRLYDRLAEFDR